MENINVNVNRWTVRREWSFRQDSFEKGSLEIEFLRLDYKPKYIQENLFLN